MKPTGKQIAAWRRRAAGNRRDAPSRAAELEAALRDASRNLPPKRLWLQWRGATNGAGDTDSVAREIEQRIAIDTAERMTKWKTNDV